MFHYYESYGLANVNDDEVLTSSLSTKFSMFHLSDCVTLVGFGNTCATNAMWNDGGKFLELDISIAYALAWNL